MLLRGRGLVPEEFPSWNPHPLQNNNCLRFAHPAEATCRPEAGDCRATAGGLEGSSTELLEAAWGLKKLSHGAPEATRAESCDTLIFEDCTKDFNDFSCDRAPSWRQQWAQNWFQIASSTLNASERLLADILEAIIALLEPSWPLLNAS